MSSTMAPEVMNKVINWFLDGETGLSSKTIVAGISNQEFDSDYGEFSPSIPYDVSDFRRCYQLLEAVPELKKELHLVADKFPEWQPFVDNWDDLTTMYINEKANNPEELPDLYKVIKGLVKESEDISQKRRISLGL